MRRETNKVSFFSILTLFAVLGSVSIPCYDAHAVEISIGSFDKIELGTSVKKIEMMLGKPTAKFDVGGQSGNKFILWVYREKMKLDGVDVLLDRLTLEFDKNFQTVTSKNYLVYENESLSVIDRVVERYKQYQFSIVNPKFCDHFLADEITFIDSKNGFAVTQQNSSKKVSSISSWRPNRKLANNEQTSCEPTLPSKQVE